MDTVVFDFRAIEIAVGDRIAYPVRKGSEMKMKHGVVRGIRNGVLDVENHYTGKNVTIIRSDRVAVLGR